MYGFGQFFAFHPLGLGIQWNAVSPQLHALPVYCVLCLSPVCDLSVHQSDAFCISALPEPMLCKWAWLLKSGLLAADCKFGPYTRNRCTRSVEELRMGPAPQDYSPHAKAFGN